MNWWILMFCLIVSIWGLVDTCDRDPGACRLWMVAILIVMALTFLMYADEEGLWAFGRDVCSTPENGAIGAGPWHEDPTDGKTL